MTLKCPKDIEAKKNNVCITALPLGGSEALPVLRACAVCLYFTIPLPGLGVAFENIYSIFAVCLCNLPM